MKFSTEHGGARIRAAVTQGIARVHTNGWAQNFDEMGRRGSFFETTRGSGAP